MTGDHAVMEGGNNKTSLNNGPYYHEILCNKITDVYILREISGRNFKRYIKIQRMKYFASKL